MKVYAQFFSESGSFASDFEATLFDSVKSVKTELQAFYADCSRYGDIEPGSVGYTIHYPNNTHTLYNEYPEYILTIGPRGAIRKERT